MSVYTIVSIYFCFHSYFSIGITSVSVLCITCGIPAEIHLLNEKKVFLQLYYLFILLPVDLMLSFFQTSSLTVSLKPAC